MSYNIYNDVNNIYKQKEKWHNANIQGDEKAKNEAAVAATQYYKSLRDNGYESVANDLQKSDYTAAKKINDKYAMAGKSAIRPYLYQSKLKNTYGLTNGQIDSLLTFNETTGEVSLGGKSLGKPFSLVDGTSYWDPKDLDVAIDDYINRTELTASDKNMASKATKGVSDKTDQVFDKQMSDSEKWTKTAYDFLNYANQDITKTDEYKSTYDNIMPSYKLSALQKRDNVAAANASSNGGNIDSYAANQAARQQAALTAKGQALAHQMGLDAYAARVSGVQNILAQIGGYQQTQDEALKDTIGLEQDEAQRLFTNDLTNKATIAEVTGYAPKEWTGYNNPYIDDASGKLKPEFENKDFKEALNKARENGASEEEIRLLKEARGAKIFGNYDKWREFDDNDWAIPQKEKINATKLAEAGFDLEKYLSDNQKETQMDINAANLAATIINADMATGVAMIEAEAQKYDYDTEAYAAKVDAYIRQYESDNEYNSSVLDYDAKVLDSTLDYDANVYKADKDYDANVLDSTLDYNANVLKSENDLKGTMYTADKKSEKETSDSSKKITTNMKKFINYINEYAEEKGWPALLRTDGTLTSYGEKLAPQEFLANRLKNSEHMLTDDEIDTFIGLFGIKPGTLDTVINGEYARNK